VGPLLHLAEKQDELKIVNTVTAANTLTGSVQSNNTFRKASLLRHSAAGIVLASALAAIGCGSTYRPVVTSINPVGPAGQPGKYAVVMSNPGAGLPGLITIIDAFGDATLVNANVGAAPTYLQVDPTGSTGFTINGDGSVNSFSISASLMTNQILTTTLLSGAVPVSLVSQGTNVYIAQGGRNSVAQLTGTPPALKTEISTGTGTYYTVSISGAVRVYTLVRGNGTTAGTAVPIETGANTPDAAIPVGINPVYGVMTADGRRAFIMNQGSNTISTINAQTNTLDATPVVNPSTGAAVTSGGNPVLASSIPVGVAPVWADFAPTLNELLVANKGNGTTAGSVSIISIPLCSVTAISDPNCSTTNPIDANGFGSTVATIPVGVNPVMIAVLQDGTQAYVANAGVPATSNSPGIAGSVSVINLLTNTVVATLTAPNTTDTDLLDNVLHGHPNWIAVTTGTPTGKVYVTSGDANDITIINTNTNTVATHLNLQGTGIAVRVSAQ